MANAPSSIERTFARLLRPFAKVEPEEAITAVVMTITLFLLLTAYYLLKTAREPLILLHGGAEVKSYAAAGQSMLLLVAVPAYGALAKRVGRMTLLASVYLFFVSNLAIFAALARAHANIGVAFYLWVGIFNMMAVSQFWNLAADVYTPEQGKRLFAILGIGGSTGAYAGSQVAKSLAGLGPQGLIIVAAAILVAVVLLLMWAERRASQNAEQRGSAAKGSADAHDEPVVGERTWALFMRDKYLLLAGTLTLIINWVNSNGEYILDRTLLEAVSGMQAQGVDPEKFVGHFKGDYFGWVNLVGMLLQLFVVSRVLDKLGVRAALFFLPGVAFVGYSLMATAPVLSLLKVAKISENSLDYSIQKTSFQALFLVASRVEKYVGKTAIETLIVRIGDVFSAGLVAVASAIGLSTRSLAGVNLVLIATWVVILVAIGKEHRRRSDESPELLALEPLRT
ncbi:NTP/NDP exchange transporter [Pendulispora albinea]|uniref:MFS transporter n=1 Tax=Pendulispora albinea TaxID=2741071 RepID=A0ABZ2LVF1_9BACT